MLILDFYVDIDHKWMTECINEMQPSNGLQT